MNNLLEPETAPSSPSSCQQFPAQVYRLLYFFIWATVVVALLAGTLLLVRDVFWTILPHAPISAAPLLSIGVTYLGFQVLMRPKLLDLLKALIVSSAFLLWGVDQLLPTGWFATLLGDVVIVLYVIDLGWMMVERLKQHWKSRHATSGAPGNERGIPLSQRDARVPLLRLDASTPEEKRHASSSPIRVLRGNPSFLKRKRLAPLACTCDSPLAPFRSSACCKEMQDARSS
jgi:hypothetical protein